MEWYRAGAFKKLMGSGDGKAAAAEIENK